MSNLVLDSLEIKNFRAFKHLRIEKLGRVNLIVGKNNVGKSSVLEAIKLYADNGDPNTILEMLFARNEVAPYDGISATPDGSIILDRVLALRHLFHGRGDVRNAIPSIEIGPVNSESTRTIISVNPMANAYKNAVHPLGPVEHQEKLLIVGKADALGVVVDIGPQFRAYYALDQGKPPAIRARTMPSYFPPVDTLSIAATGLNSRRIASLWDNVALSDLEIEVLSALQIIALDVEHLNFVGSEGQNGERIPKVRVAGTDGPIPLRSMGEGMNRMLGIALALVNAKDGMLLIDEVDTGLHYSVLPDLWKLIFEVAHRLNVQVFATSHSWDCIQAFQQAADANKEEEGIVIRLETQDGEVVPVVFDERKLNIATREHIEVR